MTGHVLATAAAAGALLVGAPATDGLDAVVQRTANWVQQFEHDFITVIADETYDQFASRWPAPGEQHRQMRSELLFVRGEAGDMWSAVRNVLAYTDEGRPTIAVPNSRDRLAQALERGRAGRTALRRLADEGARFNIGRIVRNFNTPTLALQFLDDRHRTRFRFRLEGSEVIGTDMAWRLSYDERVHPTLIQANYRDTALSGRIWARATDGAVLRTRMQLVAAANRGLAGLRTLITVDYTHDSKLGTFVPARMEEEYVGQGGGESIRGTAVYSNYQVFETSAKVIVPQ